MFLKVCIALMVSNFLVFGWIAYLHWGKSDGKENLKQLNKHIMISGFIFLSLSSLLWLFGSLSYRLVKFWEGLVLVTSTVFSVSLLCGVFEESLTNFSDRFLERILLKKANK